MRRLLLILVLLALAPPGFAAESFRILSQNMNRLFDDVDDGNREKVLSSARFERRIATAATRFEQRFKLPDIIALQEVENRNVLARIAARIEASTGSAYRGILLPGQDRSGINLGFLVSEGISVRRVEQLFRDDVIARDGLPLFTRPPLLIEACRAQRCLLLLNLHLRSMRGLDDPKYRSRVLNKRRRQAESIAAWVQRQQTDYPDLSLMLLGDFNALTPADEHIDIAGILRGNPDNGEGRARGRDLIEPDLNDLSTRIPAQRRYSYIFRRQKQQLDYMFVNQAFAARVESIEFSRIDYDFSDHAGLVVTLRF